MLNRGDLKKRLNLYEIYYDRTRKRWSFNTGDCFIEVTAWAGLTFNIGYFCIYLVESYGFSCLAREKKLHETKIRLLLFWTWKISKFSSKFPKISRLKCMVILFMLIYIAATGNSCFWLADCLKNLLWWNYSGQMSRNLVGSIYRRSSIKIARIVLIRQQTWLP
jgi:hypothetical protein